jgi:hypothetical protein
MTTRYFITSENNIEVLKGTGMKGQVEEYSFDFTQWAEDNDDVDAVTWTVEKGDATVSSTLVTSNVATGLVTMSAEGGNMIKLLASTGDGMKRVVKLDLLVKDPQQETDDYEL